MKLVCAVFVLILTVSVYSQSSIVVDEGAALLTKPAADGKLVRKMHHNEAVRIIRTKGDWLYVRAEPDSGWISSRSVQTGSVKGARAADVPANPPADPATAAQEKIVSGGVLNGRAIKFPPPTYPAMAKAARASGSVTVEVLIDEHGDVVSASAISGHPLLQDSAVTAARAAKFSPLLLAGKPVKVKGVLVYTFRM
jgi:TonB family protein